MREDAAPSSGGGRSGEQLGPRIKPTLYRQHNQFPGIIPQHGMNLVKIGRPEAIRLTRLRTNFARDEWLASARRSETRTNLTYIPLF